MEEIKALLQNPTRVMYVYLAVWALAALGHTMPAPEEKSSKGYRWFYNFMQFVLANLANLQIGGGKNAG